MIKYLEIDSTYRNRGEFPNPTRFDLITAQSGTQITSSSSISPISLASPIVSYIPNDIDNLISGNVQASETNISTSFIVCFPVAQNANKRADYYRAVQANILVTISSTTTDIGRVTIESWDYLNTVSGEDCFRVTFSPAIDAALIPSITQFKLVVATDYTLGNIFIPNGNAASQVYKDYLIYNETQNLYTTVLAYDGANSLVSIDPQPTWVMTDTISLRKELPQEYGTFQVGSTTSSVVLDATANPVTGSLNGSFLRITQPGSPNLGQVCSISSYTGSPTFVATLSCVLPTTPIAGDTYEILSFTKDGYVPLNYTGTHTTQEVCYEIQLVNLILPNVGVKSGGVMASYPYFYVEFQNYTTSNGGTTNVIYSNNPNSTRKLFRIPVSDISPASLNSFLTLDKCYMAQMVRLTPYNSFKFGVYLPNGEPLELSIPDTVNPASPDPALQVSALFSLRKI